MNEIKFDKLERSILQTAQNFPYPPTPDLVARSPLAHALTRSRTWAYALAALLVALAALLAVPEVRARLLELLQIGAVRIEVAPTPTEQLGLATQEEFQSLDRLIAVADLKGETSLDEARLRVDFAIPLPTYPPVLGTPDHVYVQSIEPPDSFVILVWMDAEAPNEVELAFYVIGPGITLTKGPEEELLVTSVNDAPAAYVHGAHYLHTELPDFGVLVQAPALIWEADGITYRIEADLPLEELVRIAESLE
jgi:hypothetical protein